jgi:RimJ/RimL family protein N-acetyltransferase
MSPAYHCLSTQIFRDGDFFIVPIRTIDRYSIMQWRNEQLYHLRQSKPLTKADQDHYFNNVIKPQFSEVNPNQILFSFLENDQCIGYGGLVHIDWESKNAEISFILKTSLEKVLFTELWNNYLNMIEKVAFKELKFRKIYVYAFDLRPALYKILKQNNFMEEARLKDQKLVENNRYVDVLIYSKINQ